MQIHVESFILSYNSVLLFIVFQILIQFLHFYLLYIYII